MSEAPAVHPSAMVPSHPQPLVVIPTKSVGLAIFLAVFFGPVGLLYSTVTGALVMFFINVLVGLLTLGLGLILTWPICGLWAAVATKSYNAKLLAGQSQ